MASRSERKRLYAFRKQEVLEEIAEVAATAIERGKSVSEALIEVDIWTSKQVLEAPQEAQLYRDAIVEYCKLLKEQSERNKTKGAVS